MQKKYVNGYFLAFQKMNAFFSVIYMRNIDLLTKPNKHWMTAKKEENISSISRMLSHNYVTIINLGAKLDDNDNEVSDNEVKADNVHHDAI